MTETDRRKVKPDETRTDKIYLPAVANPLTYGRIEDVIADLFDLPGRDLISDSLRK